MNNFIANRQEIEKANRKLILKWEKLMEFRDLTEDENNEYEKIKNSFLTEIGIIGKMGDIYFRCPEAMLHLIESSLVHRGFIVVGEVNPMPPIEHRLKPEMLDLIIPRISDERFEMPKKHRDHKGHERPYKYHR